MQRYAPYLHSNLYKVRRICLDGEMPYQNHLTDIIVVRSSDMIERFLYEAKRASELAKRTEASLLLLIFCHGFPNYHLLLDSSKRSRGLSIITLKGILEPGAPFTLVTTACYSRRWVITPELNSNAVTAAGTEEEFKSRYF